MDNGINIYRTGVGIVLRNLNNEVFIAKRNDMSGTDPFPWQLPQGGVDHYEPPLHAAKRELKEETGIHSIELIYEMPDWINYDLPLDLQSRLWGGKYKGQTQKWFLFDFKGQDSEINLDQPHPEFCEWKWAKFDELMNIVVPFKRQVYEEIHTYFKPYFEAP
jgi:putative (di)nucleoside polyphosphate hydrolase